MNGLCKIELLTRLDVRQNRIEAHRQLGLRTDEIDVAQELVRLNHVEDGGTDGIGENHEDAHNLAAFLALQFTDAVVRLDHLGRLNINRSARVGFIMDNTIDLALHRRCHRDDQSAVAHRRCRIAFNDTLSFRLAKNTMEHTRDAIRCVLFLLTDTHQLDSSRIFHFAIFVENLTDASHQVRVCLDVLSQG